VVLHRVLVALDAVLVVGGVRGALVEADGAGERDLLSLLAGVLRGGLGVVLGVCLRGVGLVTLGLGDGVLRPSDVAAGILGAVVSDPVADQVVWSEYLEAVVRERRDWSDFYRACREVGQ